MPAVPGMAMDGQMADKLRGFLRELTPRARAMLLAELERGESRGDRLPGSDLIMRELRQVEQASARPAPPPPPPPPPSRSPRPACRDGGRGHSGRPGTGRGPARRGRPGGAAVFRL